MLYRLPVEVNPFRLVEQKKRLIGIVPLLNMKRLAEIALDGSEGFTVDLNFGRSSSNLPMVTGRVQGKVVLACQRCLEPLPFVVDSQIQVALTAFQSDERPEQEGYETCLVEDERLFILDFVEDEILLALPLVARHEQCEPVRPLIEALPPATPEPEVPQVESGKVKQNPFAVLKDWKKTE